MNQPALKLWTNNLSVLIAYNGLILFVFILLIGHYYRLVPEDYYALQGNHKYGVCQQAVEVCKTWGGRFFSYLFSFVLLYFFEQGYSYAWYFFCGNLILIVSFYSIFSFICNRYNIRISFPETFSVSIMAFIGLFYMTPGLQESWFWVAASPSYYWGLVMALAGCAIICRQKIKWFHVVFSSLCFLYTCAGSEPFALMILLFMLMTFAGNWYFRKKSDWLSLSIVFFFALTGFLLMYFSKGTSNRWMAMPDLSLVIKLKRCFAAVFKYCIYWLPTQTLLMVLFSPFSFLAGNFVRTKNTRLPEISFLKFTSITVLTYATILFLSFAPSCFVMGEPGPLRSWHHIGLYNMALGFVFFGYCGYRYGSYIFEKLRKINLNKTILTYVLILLSMLHTGLLFKQFVVVKSYSKAVDNRIALLNELKKRKYTGTVTLQKLPPSGFLFSAEIGKDKDYYLNSFLKNGLELSFDIRVDY